MAVLQLQVCLSCVGAKNTVQILLRDVGSCLNQSAVAIKSTAEFAVVQQACSYVCTSLKCLNDL